MLRTAARGRYVKVVQTGSTGGLYWSAHEFSLACDAAFPEAAQAGEKLDDLLAGHGLVARWDVSGPYRVNRKKGPELCDVEFWPEVAAEFARWRPVAPEHVTDGVVDLAGALGGGDRVAYLRSVVTAGRAADVELGLGSDDGIKAWLNGEVVHEDNATRAHMYDQGKVRVRMKRGRNVLLLKIMQGGGGWEASARFRR